ncbi:transcriptional regulator, TetR family [Blastococcus aggregatus]|uniref:Transcriptional regulator, TetR family n=1 Tax=Blastococcus aggregatus TaxID=38502 RepID=A0A285V6U2_9ACTN|nr:TetR family transcriptional regulator [Blastococcus aggregatus]SOC49770.1 transcriptional regulator, TetR family [Blastococcus aggregatus]
MTTPGLRERKKQDTRAALAAATLRLAVEHGLAAVTVEQIAAAAGVSYRTFFNHFSVKEEALLRPAGTERTFAVHLAEQEPQLPPLPAARAALRSVLADLDADREAWLQRLSVIAAEPDLLPRLVELGTADERAMAEAIAARTGLDVDTDLYPGLLAAVLSCALRVTLNRWHRRGGREPLDRLFGEAVDALAAGLPGPSAA